jgi:hypothetical protein
MRRCKICGRYGNAHLHMFARLLRLFNIRSIRLQIKWGYEIQKMPKEENEMIVQETITTLPLFETEPEDKNV